MADYCALADVAAYFRGITFTSTTKVTDTEINGWITQYSAYIDGRLNGKYVVPITGAESLKILKIVCSKFVAGDADKVLKSEKALDEERTKGRNLHQEAEDMLNRICEECESGLPKLSLPDATLNDDQLAKTGLPKSYVADHRDTVKPVFKKDMEF